MGAYTYRNVLSNCLRRQTDIRLRWITYGV